MAAIHKKKTPFEKQSKILKETNKIFDFSNSLKNSVGDGAETPHINFEESLSWQKA